MGRLTAPGTTPDLRPTFTTLFDLWVEQGRGRTLSGLARELHQDGAALTCQHLSRYVVRAGRKGQTDRRQPPLWLLLNLCERTGAHLEIRPDGVRMVTGPSSAASATQGGTRGGDGDGRTSDADQ